jgi:hypothetical protein
MWLSIFQTKFYKAVVRATLWVMQTDDKKSFRNFDLNYFAPKWHTKNDVNNFFIEVN